MRKREGDKEGKKGNNGGKRGGGEDGEICSITLKGRDTPWKKL